MIIIGVDLGTAKMGICIIKGIAKNPKFDCRLFLTQKKETIDFKFLSMIKNVTTLINKEKPDLIVCEYPFAIKGHAKILVEMFGVVRYHCLINKIPFLPLSQPRIKKYAIGRGKDVEKSAMVMRAYKEYSLELSEDEADAFWIAHVGMTYLYGSSVSFRQESINDIKKKMIKAEKQNIP
jgi:Holliday junction resolvasome RuvABC endonuclease subunit